jgi:hypothetical protein
MQLQGSVLMLSWGLDVVLKFLFAAVLEADWGDLSAELMEVLLGKHLELLLGVSLAPVFELASHLMSVPALGLVLAQVLDLVLVPVLELVLDLMLVPA